MSAPTIVPFFTKKVGLPLVVAQLLVHLWIFFSAEMDPLLGFWLMIYLPFGLILYFLLPLFVLVFLQVILYLIQTPQAIQAHNRWALRLKTIQHNCTYWFVLIVWQSMLSYLVFH